MRWRAVACAALGATAVVCSAIAASAPQEPAPSTPPPSAESSFRSVRSYVDVAEPARLRIPALGIDAPLTHLGVAPDRSIEVPTDYAKAHELAYSAYQDMFGLAKQLSEAFGETVAARLPQGGAETGAGGTAPR